MKSILAYGQAINKRKQDTSFKAQASVACNAGQALREGYKLKGYTKHQTSNGLSYWSRDK